MVHAVSDLIQLRVRAMAHGGDAVAHPEDPDKKETWFVRGGLPGEIVRVRPSPPKGRHLRGEVAEVVEASENRTEPPCAHAGTCGGCQWQHVGLDAQLALKEEIVRGALRRLPLELRRAVPSPEGLGYRRRARMHYRNEDGEFSLGFFGAGSRDVVDIPRCIVLHPVLDQALQRLRALAPQLPERGEVHAITDGERVVIGLGGVSPSRARLDAASALLDDVVVGITLRGGRKRETVGVSALAIDGDHGRLPIVTTPFVFAQAQAEQNEALVKHVAKATSSEGHKVLELFCGGGNLTRAVAEGAAGVWAVDDDREAIARLRDMVKAVGLPVRLEGLEQDRARALRPSGTQLRRGGRGPAAHRPRGRGGQPHLEGDRHPGRLRLLRPRDPGP